MSRTEMPRDDSGTHVQVLRLLSGGAHQISIGAGSLRNGSAFNSETRVIEVHATVDCYIQTGGSGITASSADHFLPADVSRVYSVGGERQSQHTHIAVIQVTSSGTLYVSELE